MSIPVHFDNFLSRY